MKTPFVEGQYAGIIESIAVAIRSDDLIGHTGPTA